MILNIEISCKVSCVDDPEQLRDDMQDIFEQFSFPIERFEVKIGGVVMENLPKANMLDGQWREKY